MLFAGVRLCVRCVRMNAIYQISRRKQTQLEANFISQRARDREKPKTIGWFIIWFSNSFFKHRSLCDWMEFYITHLWAMPIFTSKCCLFSNFGYVFAKSKQTDDYSAIRAADSCLIRVNVITTHSVYVTLATSCQQYTNTYTRTHSYTALSTVYRFCLMCLFRWRFPICATYNKSVQYTLTQCIDTKIVLQT